MTGELFDAATLERWNVVNRVLPDEGFAAAAEAFARGLAEGPTRAHAATKAIVRAQVEGGARAADERVPELAGDLFATEDLQGAVRSFLENGPGHGDVHRPLTARAGGRALHADRRAVAPVMICEPCGAGGRTERTSCARGASASPPPAPARSRCSPRRRASAPRPAAVGRDRRARPRSTPRPASTSPASSSAAPPTGACGPR